MAIRVARYGWLLSMVAMSLALSCGDDGMDDRDDDAASEGEDGAGGGQAGSRAGRSGESNEAGDSNGGSVAGPLTQAGENGHAGDLPHAGAAGDAGAGDAGASGGGGEAGGGGENTPEGGQGGAAGTLAGGGSGGGVSGSAGTLGGGGTGGAMTCESCMEKNCPAPLEALDTQCVGTVCEDLRACFDEDGCDEEDPRLCYCGTVAFTDCLSSFVSTVPNGACKTEIDEVLVPAFVPVNIPQLMAPFLLETTNPVGANFQVAICQTRECAALCNIP